MKNKWFKLAVILGGALLLTGCWDNVELNERHIVLDVAVDKGEQSDYQVTYSIPDIAKLSGKDSLSEEVKTVLSAESATIGKSIKEMENKTQDTISLSHTKAILFGSELMADPALFKAAIDSFKENSEIGRGTYLLAVRGNAGEMSHAQSYQNPILGLYLMKYFNNEERMVATYEVKTLSEFGRELQETGISTLPLIGMNQEENTLKLGGAALIQNYKLVDWLTEEEVRAKLLVAGKVRGMPIAIREGEDIISYEVSDETARKVYRETGDQLSVTIYIEAEGKLAEYDPDILRAQDREVILSRISEDVSEEIRREVTQGIEKMQAIGIDFMGLSEGLYRQAPNLFKKYKAIWEEGRLDDLIIDVHVQTVIQNIGNM